MLPIKHFLTLSLVFAFVLNCNSAEQIKKEKQIFIKKGGGHSLGAVITDVQEDSEVKEGALLLEILDDSEAEQIGLKEDDIFVEFEGEKIKTAKQLYNLVKDIEEEKKVMFKINRDGKIMDFEATMKKIEAGDVYHVNIDNDDVDVMIAGDLPKPHTGIMIPKMKNYRVFSGSDKGGFLGVMTDDLSESMLEYFEVEYGVLVEEVVKDSPAEKAGFQAGDVIYKVEGREIHDYQDLVRTLNYYDPEDEVKIEYSRKGSKKSIEVKLGKKDGHRFGYKFSTDKKGHHDDHLIWIDEEMDDKPMKIMKKLQKIDEDGVMDFDIDLEIYII